MIHFMKSLAFSILDAADCSFWPHESIGILKKVLGAVFCHITITVTFNFVSCKVTLSGDQRKKMVIGPIRIEASLFPNWCAKADPNK